MDNINLFYYIKNILLWLKEGGGSGEGGGREGTGEGGRD